MKNTNKSTKKKQKQYGDVMSAHIGQIKRLINVTKACQRGLFILTKAEKSSHARVSALKALIEYADLKGRVKEVQNYKKELEDSDGEIEAAKEIQAVAQREKDTDYALLFSFALISLWSILESMSKEFLVSWIKANPKLLRADKVKDIKLVLGEYEPLTAADKIKYILSLVDRNINGSKRSGVNRFENFFSSFDLGGSVPQELSKHIYEFQQIRNSLAHDGFISGKQLRTACPWLFKPRQTTLTVTGEMFSKYAVASIHYCWLIECRADEYMGKAKGDSFRYIFKQYGEEYSLN